MYAALTVYEHVMYMLCVQRLCYDAAECVRVLLQSVYSFDTLC
jgi:hypothetical protein